MIEKHWRLITLIGVVYSNTGDNQKALDYHNKARDIDESLNRRVHMASDYSNIGIVYKDMGDNQKALDYHNKAREIHESLNDRVDIARTNYKMSFPLYEVNEKSKALNHLSIGQSKLT